MTAGEWGGEAEDAGRERRLRPARRGRAALVHAGLVGCVGIVLVLAVAAALVPPPAAGSPTAEAPAGPAAPAWIGISHPLQLFSLAGSPFVRLPLAYEARRRPDGSARQDVLTFGGFAAAGPFLKLSVDTGGEGSLAPSDLVVTAARIAGAAGIAVTRAGQPDGMPSRFGLFEVAPLTLRSGGAEKPCLGFRLQGRPPVGIAGVACGGEGRELERVALACALDRLDLAFAGDDTVLRGFFVEAERRRRPGCGAARTGNGAA